jgi:outer membrane protein assembly factor BamE (lipoprotein component of BamABCDE complex)
MTRLRFAEMKIKWRSLHVASLIAVTALSMGCNKSQPTVNGPEALVVGQFPFPQGTAMLKRGMTNEVSPWSAYY